MPTALIRHLGAVVALLFGGSPPDLEVVLHIEAYMECLVFYPQMACLQFWMRSVDRKCKELISHRDCFCAGHVLSSGWITARSTRRR